MSEKEIIKNIKEMIQWSDHSTYKMALQGLLDLYNKEKEKNKSKENILRDIQEEFNKYDWKNANPIQTYNQVKSLYQSIFLKEMEE